MAFRIAQLVQSGEIDNTCPGIVRGTLVLAGRPEPVVLELEGDCLADLAGRVCTFTNPSPLLDRSHEALSALQRGRVGDMTASRKVRIPGAPLSEFLRLRRSGKPAPESWGNCLYLEWYSETNGRVVIESTDFMVTLSLPDWTMGEESESRRRRANESAFRDWLKRLGKAAGSDSPVRVPDDRPMDEFEWERFMREADACGERYGELLEKYMDHPERDRIIAREMGWDQVEKALEDLGVGRLDSLPELDDDALDDAAAPQPDPSRQGIDWVRDDRGGICHPLVKRCHDLSMRMWRAAEKAGFAGKGVPQERQDEDVSEMLFCAQATSAKLAGALNGIANGFGLHDAGFIVASLKRALKPLNDALSAVQKVEDRGLLQAQIGVFRDGLFQVRAEIIDLQNLHRARLRDADA